LFCKASKRYDGKELSAFLKGLENYE
jgi:hypothetical protein